MNNTRAICAIAGIVILDSVALFNGIDGAMFMTAIAMIAGLGGYVLMKEGRIMLPLGLERVLQILDEQKREDV